MYDQGAVGEAEGGDHHHQAGEARAEHAETKVINVLCIYFSTLFNVG